MVEGRVRGLDPALKIQVCMVIGIFHCISFVGHLHPRSILELERTSRLRRLFES
jgi:hypothetical protein